MRWRSKLVLVGVVLLVAKVLPSPHSGWRAPNLSWFEGAEEVGTPPAAEAPTANCAAHLLGGRWPVMSDAAAVGSRGFCSEGYTLVWSPRTRDPVFSAEHLIGARMAADRARHDRGRRVDDFHAEPGIPSGERSELSDFVGSGYSRGHMAPYADMPNDGRARFDSFDLINVVPQESSNNEGLWSAIESRVRGLATRDGEVYVVTGPIFEGTQTLRGRVSVPSRLWKAVYDPRLGAGAYVARNAPGWDYDVVSIDELARLTGVDAFPALTREMRGEAARLPPPTAYQRRSAQ